MATAFSTTEGGEGGEGEREEGTFWPTPKKKQGYDYLIDLKFGTRNNWHKTINNALFKEIGF